VVFGWSMRTDSSSTHCLKSLLSRRSPFAVATCALCCRVAACALCRRVAACALCRHRSPLLLAACPLCCFVVARLLQLAIIAESVFCLTCCCWPCFPLLLAAPVLITPVLLMLPLVCCLRCLFHCILEWCQLGASVFVGVSFAAKGSLQLFCAMSDVKRDAQKSWRVQVGWRVQKSVGGCKHGKSPVFTLHPPTPTKPLNTGNLPCLHPPTPSSGFLPLPTPNSGSQALKHRKSPLFKSL